MKQEEMN